MDMMYAPPAPDVCLTELMPYMQKQTKCRLEHIGYHRLHRTCILAPTYIM